MLLGSGLSGLRLKNVACSIGTTYIYIYSIPKTPKTPNLQQVLQESYTPKVSIQIYLKVSSFISLWIHIPSQKVIGYYLCRL